MLAECPKVVRLEREVAAKSAADEWLRDREFEVPHEVKELVRESSWTSGQG